MHTNVTTVHRCQLLTWKNNNKKIYNFTQIIKYYVRRTIRNQNNRPPGYSDARGYPLSTIAVRPVRRTSTNGFECLRSFFRCLDILKCIQFYLRQSVNTMCAECREKKINPSEQSAAWCAVTVKTDWYLYIIHLCCYGISEERSR